MKLNWGAMSGDVFIGIYLPPCVKPTKPTIERNLLWVPNIPNKSESERPIGVCWYINLSRSEILLGC